METYQAAAPNRRPLIATVALAGTAVLAAMGIGGERSAEAQADKVTICHATSSETNPYVRIVVSRNAVRGHFEEQGTDQAGHEQDIVLEGEQDCPGPETPPVESTTTVAPTTTTEAPTTTTSAPETTTTTNQVTTTTGPEATTTTKKPEDSTTTTTQQQGETTTTKAPETTTTTNQGNTTTTKKPAGTTTTTTQKPTTTSVTTTTTTLGNVVGPTPAPVKESPPVLVEAPVANIQSAPVTPDIVGGIAEPQGEATAVPSPVARVQSVPSAAAEGLPHTA